MAEDPEPLTTEVPPEAPVSLAGMPDETPAPAGGALAPVGPPAPWEAEIEAFWTNVLTNVSPRVETPIHNLLFDETEALKVRLRALL